MHVTRLTTYMVLDGILRSPFELPGNVTPPVATAAMRCDERLLLCVAPSCRLDRRVELIAPPLATLLASTLAPEMRCNITPSLRSQLLHQLDELEVVCCSPCRSVMMRMIGGDVAGDDLITPLNPPFARAVHDDLLCATFFGGQYSVGSRKRGAEAVLVFWGPDRGGLAFVHISTTACAHIHSTPNTHPH